MITRVTITGPDDSINPFDLISLNNKSICRLMV